MLPGGKILESKRINKNGKSFHKIIFSSNPGTKKIKFIQYLFVSDDKAYVLTFTADADQFDRFLPVATGIMDSFEIKN